MVFFLSQTDRGASMASGSALRFGTDPGTLKPQIEVGPWIKLDQIKPTTTEGRVTRLIGFSQILLDWLCPCYRYELMCLNGFLDRTVEYTVQWNQRQSIGNTISRYTYTLYPILLELERGIDSSSVQMFAAQIGCNVLIFGIEFSLEITQLLIL